MSQTTNPMCWHCHGVDSLVELSRQTVVRKQLPLQDSGRQCLRSVWKEVSHDKGIWPGVATEEALDIPGLDDGDVEDERVVVVRQTQLNLAQPWRLCGCMIMPHCSLVGGQKLHVVLVTLLQWHVSGDLFVVFPMTERRPVPNLLQMNVVTVVQTSQTLIVQMFPLLTLKQEPSTSCKLVPPRHGWSLGFAQSRSRSCSAWGYC